MKQAKVTEHGAQRKSPGTAQSHRSSVASPRERNATPLTTRTLDYEGRIADLKQKIRELDESRAALASQLRALATKEEHIEHIHHSWMEIFDAIVDPIFMHDRQGRVVRANQAYAEMAGMDIRQVIGKYYWHVFPLRDGPLSSCSLTLSDKQESGEEDITLETGRIFRCRYFTLRDPSGEYLSSVHIMQDVTERRHMQSTLRQERDFIAAVMHTLGALVVVLDCEGRIIQFNHACETVTGFSFAEVEGKPLWDILLLPDELESVRAVFDGLSGGRFPSEHENHWRTKDGGQRLIHWSNTTLTDENGTVRYLLATGIDVTEQRAAERSLRDNEAKFRALIENASDITMLLERDGTVRYTSPSIGRVLGYGDDELVGQDFFSLVHPDDLPPLQQELAHILENPGLSRHAEHRFKDKDGNWRSLESIGKYFLNDSPISGIVVNSRDITARRMTDEKLRHSEERFRGLVETSSDLVWEVDEHTRYTYMSSRVRAVLGYEPEELLGRTPYELMPEKEAQRIKDFFVSLTEKFLPFTNLENTNVHKDGHLVVLESSGVPFFDQTGVFRGYRGIDRDITERQRADESLRRLNRALKTLSACNESLIHAVDERELLAAICQVIVDTGGYRFAWVGFAEHDEGKSVCPMAYAGEETGFLEAVRFSWGDDEAGRNPIGEAIRTGARQDIRNIEENRALQLPREEALRRGFASCIALPLRGGDRIMGVLAIYASETDAFDEGEVKLLMELADDLTYGIVALRTRAEREHVMEENRQHSARMQQALLETVEAIGSALEKRDPYTAGHQRQVAKLAHAIAQEMHIPQEAVEGIYMGGLIHDVGKIYVPAEILSRPGKLSEAEFNLVKAHPQVGHDIVKGIEFPWPVAQMILQHHERLNGSGYPQGLQGDAISLEARILAVADVVEAMASHRPYRPGLGLDKALDEISQNRGTLYDPHAVDVCLRLFREKGFTFE